MLLGHRGDVLARNHLLAAVLGTAFEPGDSFPRWLFLDPLARTRLINWAVFAQAVVGALRWESGRRPHDRRLSALFAELRRTDPDVERWWTDQAVRDYASGAKQIRHPDAGDLSFDIEIVGAPQQPDRRLVVDTAEPRSRTADLLPMLAGLTDASATTTTRTA